MRRAPWLLLLVTGCAEPPAPLARASCEYALDCAADEDCVAGACRSRRAEHDAGSTPPTDGAVGADVAALDAEGRPPAPCAIGQACELGCARAGCVTGGRCDPSSGRCEEEPPECVRDTDCGPPAAVCTSGRCLPGCGQQGAPSCTTGQVCSPRSGRCEGAQCSQDSDCQAPTPRCDPASRRCNGCRADAECGEATPVCEVSSGRCRGCQADRECSGATPACHLASGICVGCTGDQHCPATSPVCQAAQGQCRGCQSDPECGGATPACHLPSGLCLECTGDDDCGGSTPRCDGATGRCAGCPTLGCAASETCDPASGLCQSPLAALGAACAADGDCASDLCFDLGGAVGRRCVRSCSSPSDCDAGTSCVMHAGARMCLGAAQTPATAQPIDCTRDADCANGLCAWVQVQSGRWDQQCRGPVGQGPAQAQCATDLDCQSGICTQGINDPTVGFCRATCASDPDCPAGFACAFVDYGGQSYVQAPKVCLPINPLSPRTCQRDLHCPAGQGCKILQLQGPRPGLTYLANACLP